MSISDLQEHIFDAIVRKQNQEKSIQEESQRHSDSKAYSTPGNQGPEYEWIPLSETQSVVDAAKNVLENLPLSRVDRFRLQTFVKKAQRLCALLIHINRLHWIEDFCEQDFGDRMFPVKIEKKDKQTWTVSSSRPAVSSDSSSERSVEIHTATLDDRTAILAIADPHQWLFFSPVFTKDGSPYVFDYPCRLPFLKEITRRESNFSAVTERVIHKSHLGEGFKVFPEDEQIGTVVDKNGNPHVAVKEITSEKWFGPRFAEVVKNEETVLLHFQEKNKHFIKAIARYTHDNKHFFVFPWAKAGNLHEFWIKQPSLGDNCLSFSSGNWNEYIKWFFQQLIGISEAMESLHFSDKVPGGSCRHGDLKPENILCFCDEIPGPGKVPTNVILVIADAGHAKIHVQATEFRPDPTRTPRGTQRYTPPEADDPIGNHKPTSRRYDIWSLGCMYLEFLVWILYGYEGLRAFSRDVGNEFFTGSGADVQVKSQVRDWIKAVKTDPRCAPITSTAVGRLVHLIETRLLVVNIEAETTGETVAQDDNESVRPEEPKLVRADAKEMLDEIVTIKAAAVREGPGSILWIKWDDGGSKSTLVIGMWGKLNNNWTYIPDDGLASFIVRQNPATLHRYKVSKLCEKCQQHQLWLPDYEFSVKLLDLAGRSQECDFCRLLHRSMKERAALSQDTITFLRSESNSALTFYERNLRPIFSLCSTSERLSGNGIQMGFPTLLEPGSETHTQILAEWLRTCDEKHGHHFPTGDFAPSRLLDVGDRESKGVRLMSSFKHKAPLQYAALSHRWGSPNEMKPDAKTFYLTTSENRHLIECTQGLDDKLLPKTFQDAVRVTRKLGLRYVWIDSLCILQKTGKGDDSEHVKDWRRESQRMEKVFSFAYFTIAASCADHMFDGFLKMRRPREVVTMTTDDDDETFHICEDINDFDHDVEQGELNKRGWVLQERALSRRTVHFTKTQTYWECGSGIRCETFARTTK
ncbi:putative 3-phosphoinositide-dependent protein kinase 2 [Colletotrichum fructicola]|nr:putative 3-phosphoinositide-dependent protein kinase 2 [Colletotrichum fructicola]KAF4916658.1 putative 3-phosphoinositide-dependent protein kinase 2 [Colletotrichum fructicola]KAF4932678.1 putative 3-phosphoinositide-dependent protein kinase 2 [Colletotrichum fructicola]